MNEEELKQKIAHLPEVHRRRVVDSFSDLFRKLRKEWESKPQNAGKTATHRELWRMFSEQETKGPTMQFGTLARRQQGFFLDTSKYFTDAARARTTPLAQRNHHLLALGHQEENLFPTLRGGVANRFFANRKIKWWSSARSGDDPEFEGPTRNLASSQVACVNFLLPLRDNPEALVAMLRSLDPDVTDVLPIVYDARGTSAHCDSRVEFEWVGLDSTLEGSTFTRGANATSADAFLLAKLRSGAKRAYLFEWKYVEEYPLDAFKGDGKSGATRRGRYAPLYAAPASPFNGSVSLDALLYEPFYQLMRLILLGAKMVRDSEFGVSDARVVVVCPTENDAYRKRITSPTLEAKFPGLTVNEIMKRTVRNPKLIDCIPPKALATAASAQATPALKKWAAYHSARYGW